MNKQALKDRRYNTIGDIDSADDGKQTGRDARFRVVGYYDPSVSEFLCKRGFV
jgi:hypothetical protein